MIQRARECLRSARVAQTNALMWGQWIYLAGSRGSTARSMVKFWHSKRAYWIGEALAERQIHQLMRLSVVRSDPGPLLRVVR